MEKFNKLERLDHKDFMEFVKLYSLLAKSQFIFINAITQALAATDKVVRERTKLREKFTKARSRK